MNKVVDLLNQVLGLIPGNGKKTVTSLVFLGVAYLLKEKLSIEATPDQISEAWQHLLSAKDFVVLALETIGIVGLPVGLFHKSTKKAAAALGKAQWEK